MGFSKELILLYTSFFRIKDWFYIIGLAFLGFFYKRESFRFFDIFLVFIIASLYLSHGYSINNYFDLKLKKFELSRLTWRKFVFKTILFLSFALFLINCVISFFYSKSLFILVVLGAVVSFLYSSHFKYIPSLNLIFNSTGFTILFLIGYLANKHISLSALYLSGYIWLGIIPSQIIHLLAHNAVERIWPFSLTISLKFFYLSQLIWLTWTIFAFCMLKKLFPISILTLLYFIVQILILEKEKGKGLEKTNFLAVRNRYKILNIIFGFLLLSSFVIFKI